MISLVEKYLPALAVGDRIERRAVLEKIFADEGLSPVVQTEEKSETNPYSVTNYFIFPKTDDAFPLFCAHYDAIPGTCGANDNAVGVCILIKMAKALAEVGISAGFVFFDGGSGGHYGAKLFRTAHKNVKFSAVINLDMCGYGDTIAVYSRANPKKEGISAFCNSERLEAHGGKLVNFLPESDDVCFKTHEQPVLSVAVVPRWDMKYLDVLASYQGNFFGKPPEYGMMLEQMEVMTTVSGAFRDEPKYIQPKAALQVYEYLLDAVMSGTEKKRKIGLFGL